MKSNAVESLVAGVRISITNWNFVFTDTGLLRKIRRLPCDDSARILRLLKFSRYSTHARRLVAVVATGLSLVFASLHALAETVKIHEDFSKGINHWAFTEATAWELKAHETHGHVLCLTKKKSDYKPTHRSPLNIAILNEPVLGSFTMTLKVLTTEPSYGHRDLCLFFAYQGADKFHYVHLGQRTDPHSNQIFIVNEAPRTKITEKTNPGIKWKDDGHWHDVKLVRDVESGKIEVYFDDMENPVLTATDKKFKWGKIGIGSFDDRGCFADIRIEGIAVEE